jgi:N-formylglutamate amidohydrolase
MAEAAFEIIRPAGPRVPVVAHIPHASTSIPDDIRAELLVPDPELAEELVRLTDWFTDELFAGLRELGATLFVNRYSRLVFDPERFLDETAEPMAARGQGVVYWQGSQRQPLREPSVELRKRRIQQLYLPYHAALDALVGELLTESGACTIVDCHSFPSVPLPSEIDQAAGRPDICLGTDELHTPSLLADGLEAAFAAEGLRVARDRPFRGTFVPSGYHRRDARVRSVMIEVRRGLYLDEVRAERLPAFAAVAAAIGRVLARVVVAEEQSPGTP